MSFFFENKEYVQQSSNHFFIDFEKTSYMKLYIFTSKIYNIYICNICRIPYYGYLCPMRIKCKTTKRI